MFKKVAAFVVVALLLLFWLDVGTSGTTLSVGNALLVVLVTIASVRMAYVAFTESDSEDDAPKPDNVDDQRRAVLSQLERGGFSVGRQLAKNWLATLGVISFLLMLVLALWLL